MVIANPLNVFKGPDSLRKYFNPDEQPPLPLVELPAKLNLFRQDSNVKALPGKIQMSTKPPVN
ncbi:hypothetical protein FQN49_007163 [Arthroderma sp. PD_2]|nr:hypothetical protein FQN49_007163 [Arthroderma sp. PD_2]